MLQNQVRGLEKQNKKETLKRRFVKIKTRVTASHLVLLSFKISDELMQVYGKPTGTKVARTEVPSILLIILLGVAKTEIINLLIQMINHLVC